MPDPDETSAVGVVFPRGKECFPVCDLPRRQLWFPRNTTRLARSPGPPLAERPHLGPSFANAVAEGTILGHHNPIRSPGGQRKEAKDEIVGAGGSRVSNGEPSEMFRIGRAFGRWPVEDYCQTHPPLANRIERPAPHAAPALLVTRQAVEEIIAVDDDRHFG